MYRLDVILSGNGNRIRYIIHRKLSHRAALCIIW